VKPARGTLTRKGDQPRLYSIDAGDGRRASCQKTPHGGSPPGVSRIDPRQLVAQMT
jgi:hypothetical protein